MLIVWKQVVYIHVYVCLHPTYMYMYVRLCCLCGYCAGPHNYDPLNRSMYVYMYVCVYVLYMYMCMYIHQEHIEPAKR